MLLSIACAEAVGDFRVGLEHAEPRPVGDDLDLHVVLAQIFLDIASVVEREVPFRRIGVARPAAPGDSARPAGSRFARPRWPAGKLPPRRAARRTALASNSRTSYPLLLEHEKGRIAPARGEAARCGPAAYIFQPKAMPSESWFMLQVRLAAAEAPAEIRAESSSSR